MGAKDSVKFKSRRPTFKCDMCPKIFSSFRALASHTLFVHKVISKRKYQQPNILNKLLGKPVKSQEMAKKNVKESDGVETEPAQISDVRKIEYECPQCFQCFSVYFTAFKHIQKNHCINSKGIKVPSNSIEMIKPVRIEVCIKCNQRLRSNDPHSCSDMVTGIDLMATYICTGCKQQFNSLKLFDMHVTGLHCEEVETFFFPSRDEFTLWKEDIEAQTEVKYLLLDKNSASKQIYHCTYLASSNNDEDNVVHFCPSSIFVRDFTKSIQVHLYKQHFGHDSKYELPDKFNKYKIVQLLKEPAPITEPFELKSLHMDFKTLMNFLILESMKCDKATIEVLHKKAQEMLTIVNNWDEPTKSNKKNMTDEQITKTLESLDTKKRKKVDSPVVEAKKTKLEPELSTPVIVNAFSLTPNILAKERPRRKQKLDHKTENPPASFTVNNSPSSSKSSFNDSYREFVDKNFKTKIESKDSNQKSKPVKSNENVSKSSSPVPKSASKPNLTVLKTSKPNSVKKKKKTVKTKIGQFKPSLSPKKAEGHVVKFKPNFAARKAEIALAKERRNSIGKVDFEYEVREQVNDCNILVLKF